MDSRLDVASLENVEEDHNFLFLKKNLMKSFFFFLENLNFSKELKILDFFYFFIIIIFLKKFGNPKFFLKELKILIDDFFFFFL